MIGDTFPDAFGRRHAPASGEVRIVSLVPSITELICDLGLVGQLVGRTGFCIHPREALREIPKVGGTKDVDPDKVRALAPTHLIVNVDENERALVDALRADIPNVIVTHPIEVEDNLALYRLLGHVFDRRDAAAGLCDRLCRALRDVRREAFPPARVLYLIWRDPRMTIGAETYIARMLAEVGLVAVSPPSARRYPEVDLSALGADAFDAVLLSSEPYRFGEAHVRALQSDPAVGGRPVMLVDGEMCSWYGSRAISGVEYLREFRRSLDAARAAVST